MWYTGPMDTKTCKTCNEQFTQKRSKQVYCSQGCQRSRGRTIVSRTCIRPGCDESFVLNRPTDKKKYCSKSCAAKVNNRLHPKRTPEGSCAVCSTPTPVGRIRCEVHALHSSAGTDVPDSKRYRVSLCGYNGCQNEKAIESITCKTCFPLRQRSAYISRWKSGEGVEGGQYRLPTAVREYILEKYDYRCAECNEQYFHPIDGKTVNQVDHINGNGFDHREENLRVLCPTHHALTDTFGNRNAGNGRDSLLVKVMDLDTPEGVDIEVIGVVV